jgi:MraZ protein
MISHDHPNRFGILALSAANPVIGRDVERARQGIALDRMTHFLGTHQNRLDAKGRVSVPASFRAALKNGGDKNGGDKNGDDKNGGDHASLILRPSHKQPCIEAWPLAVFTQLETPLQELDLFSEAHDDMAAALYADAYPLEADKEGRILLPASLVIHADLTDAVVFMGLGRIFQIWEPGAAEKRRAEARERARARGLTLPGSGSAFGSATGSGA